MLFRSARVICLLSLSMMLMRFAAALDLPPVPPSPLPLVDAFAYADDAAAQAVWIPMAGSPGVSCTVLGDNHALRLGCPFANTDMPRASWDFQVKLDLASARGIQFQLFCPNPEPIGYFTVYFRSGAGWYSVTAGTVAPGVWNTITARKEQASVEGEPAGWSAVDAIRISAWRLQPTDTECFIAQMAVLGTDAPLVMVGADCAASQTPNEARTAQMCAETALDYLESCGLDCVFMSDAELTPDRLKGRQAVILPYSPCLPDSAVDALDAYMAGGGKLVCFYTLPQRLLARTGMAEGIFVRAEAPGAFASIRPSDTPLNGMPEIVLQQSGNLHTKTPIEGRSRVAAWWHDSAGNRTAYPAVVVSDQCVFMSHILLQDDMDNKRQLLLAMAGQAAPDCWARAAKKRLAAIETIGPFTSFDAFATAVAESGSETARMALEETRAARAQSQSDLDAGRFAEAMAGANKVASVMRRAYCALQKPAPNEHRAFWCHSAYGVDGMTWDEAIHLLAENGFTDILPNMLWGGSAYYESQVLPVAADVATRGDAVAACVAACRKYGVRCHVWKVNFNMGWSAPKAFRERMKAEGRTQVLFDGSAEDQWLCPSHPDNQALEINAMVEVAANYDVDGVHFDYIRYPHDNACFCPGCRQRFEVELGHPVAHWPDDLRQDPALKAKWLSFRCAQITRVVAGVHEALEKVKPHVALSAAVFPNYLKDRDEIGQDWKLWCERGYLDFVCPMDYQEDSRVFDRLVAEQRGWAGPVPCYPGIGLSCWKDSVDVVKLIEQIGVTRQHAMQGFTVFNYGVAQAREVLPLCGLGITRP